ncbi:choice-of-anchor J domain-containing protein [Porphyromonas gulae]|nr:choice-of-anchor J domain-containing protein [Porphyromonas gulae]
MDADGDGNNWTTTPPPGGSSFSGHNGGSCVSSASYINYQGAQTPDNYLVTPELSLANGGTLPVHRVLGTKRLYSCQRAPSMLLSVTSTVQTSSGSMWTTSRSRPMPSVPNC